MSGDLVLADPAVATRATRLAREIGEALAKLAVHGTPTQIALQLAAEGYVGRRGDALSCPVANYLTAAVGGDRGRDTGQVTVSQTTWGVATRERELAAGAIPEAVSAFVRRFDHGSYEELSTGGRPVRPITVDLDVTQVRAVLDQLYAQLLDR